MQSYIGTKQVEAKPMTRGEYNTYRGWTTPINENPHDEGYLVKYDNGYESWSPEEVFEKSYRKVNGLTFGTAIELLKQGKKLARSGWNGKNMYLYYVPANSYPPATAIAKEEFKGENVPYSAYIAIKSVQRIMSPWVASQTDMLAEDWQVVD